MRVVFLALTFGLLLTITPQARAQPADETLGETIARRSLAELGARPPEAERLLERNMSRYFVAFPLLAGAENRQAVLQGTLRSTARFVGGVLMLAVNSQGSPNGSGAVHLTDDSVASALDRILPRRTNEWDETVFFPEGAAVSIETWDLKAMEATGTAWAALGFLVQQPIPQRLADATISDAAVDRLAKAAGDFAVLALRMAGEDARQARDSYVQARHLRAGVAKLQELRQATGPVSLWSAGERSNASGSVFTDVTAASGVDFRHVSSDWIARFRRWGEDAPTFSGGGVAARDLTGDGRPDLVFCGGGGCRLYRNQTNQAGGHGIGIVFDDVTAAAGLEVPSDSFEARMPLPADFDGDGDLDLFVTAARDGNRLYRNDSKDTMDSADAPKFVDITAVSGLSRPGDVSGPAAAFDADGDGDLDLFVGNFGDYLSGESPWLSPDSRNGQPNRLFLNQFQDEGHLRFEEATDAGQAIADTGWAQAVSHFDFDGDGDQDVYVANDFGRNELLRNRGDGTFERAGAATGGDDPFHGMNAAFADLDRDRLPDVFITNIWTWNPADGSLGETNSLLLSQTVGDGVAYKNVAAASGLTDADTGWAWGALFFDADHDGLDDLLVLSGLHDYNTFFQWRPLDGASAGRNDQLVPTTHRREPNVFFRGQGLQDQLPRFGVVAGSGAELPGVNSRGLALADFDGDGDLDVALSSFHDHARILRNDSGQGRWLQVELVGGPGRDGQPPVNLDAVGTVVVATAPDTDLYVWRMATGGEGYLSASQRALHFGVGTAERVDLEIIWPGGATQTLSSVPTNRRVRVVYGEDSFDILGE